MKKFSIFLISLMVPVCSFAQVQTVLDFNTYEEQIQQVYTTPENQLLTVNGDFQVELGSEMFMLDNWFVELSPSSSNDISMRDSYSKSVNSTEQGNVLGVRVSFPEWTYQGEALIRPKFPVLPFNNQGEYINLNNGVVTNVGKVQSFSMWANGRNFNFTTGVRMIDDIGKIIEFGLGSLRYVGWRKLKYNNRFFSDRAINNIEKTRRLYPNTSPLLAFHSIAIYKPANEFGGDFVAYFGSADIEYTPYLTEEITDINDEATWGIIQEEQLQRAQAINTTLYEEVLQYEYAKQRALTINGNEGEAAAEVAADNAAAVQ